MYKDIYDTLKQVAAERRLVTYKELAKSLGLDWNRNYGKCRQIFSVLGAVSTSEVEHGHPMLSAIAVRQDTKQPGTGFFNVARDLGVYQGRHDYSFWTKQRDAVWNFYSSRPKGVKPKSKR